MEYIIYAILGIVGIYLLYKLFVFLKKKKLFEKVKVKVKKEKEKKEKTKKKVLDNASTVKIVEKYMFQREVKTLIALNRVLPREYIALPKVGVVNLVEPEGNRNLFNLIKDYFIDFVVFERASMKPKLIVDIYDNSFEDELLRHRHPELMEVLVGLNLPCIELIVKGDINLGELEKKIFDALKIEKQ